MAKKRSLVTPNYFDYYVNGKGSGPSPDLFKQYSGSSISKYLDSTSQEVESASKDEQTKRLEKEVENLKKRGEASGSNTKKDDRNSLEKFLNMGQDQGLFGDALELMQRPINGVTNAQNESLKRANVYKDLVKQGKMTEKEYIKQINKDDIADMKKLPGEFMEGLKGHNKTTSSDVLGTHGMEDGWKRTLLGLGLDIGEDPFNLVGGPLGKVVTKTAKLTGKGASKLLDVVDKNQVLKEGTAEVVDTFKRAFANTAPKEIKAQKAAIESTKNMMQEKSLGVLNNLLKQNGVESGEDAAQIMEHALQNNPKADDFIQKIVDGSNEDTMRLRGALDSKGNLAVGQDVEDAVKSMNNTIHNSESFAATMGKKQGIKANVTQIVAGLASKYKGIDELDNMAESVHEVLSKDGLSNFLTDVGSAKNENSLIATINKYDDSVIQKAGLDKDMIREIAVDKFNMTKALNTAKKSKDSIASMFNPIRINPITDGGEGFQITKTNSSLVSKGVKDREAVLQKFGKDTVTIPRLQRELNTSRGGEVVAQQLTKLQDGIVEWGKESGVDIPTIEGYMRHALTEEYKNLNMKPNVTGMGKQFGGNKKIINPRDLYGSAQDVNEMMGKNVFETNAYKAMVQAHTKVTNYIATEAFLKEVMANPDLVTKVTKNTDITKFLHPKTGKLARGYEELRISDFKFYKTLDEDAKTIMAVRPNDKFIIQKGVKELMQNYDELVSTPSTMQNLLKYTLDPATKLWKGITLMSAGYHARNLIGNSFNRHIAGMGVAAQGVFDKKAAEQLWAYQREILPKIAKGEPIEGNLKAIQDEVEEFYSSGLRDSAKIREEMGAFDNRFEKLNAQVKGEKLASKSVPTKVLNGLVAAPKALMGLNYKVSSSADDMQRFSMYMWAKGKNMKDPVQAVKAAMFDYSDLTTTERALFKRVMPFYTFSRKNLPFQVQNFVTQPHKYNNANKMIQASYDLTDQDKENMPEFLKKSMAIGSPFGKNELLKSYLPMSDLPNFLDDASSAPKQAVSMTAPALKLLFEESANKDFFRGQPIQNFDGEKSKTYGGINPYVAYALDQFGGKTADRGIDVLKNMAALGKGEDVGNKASALIPSLFSTYDPEQVKKGKLYDERTRLQDMQKKYEQDTGKEWKKLNDLKKEGTYFGF